MTLSTISAPRARDTGKIRIAARSAPHLLDLANQLRADEQLHHALQVPGTALLGQATDGVPLLIRLASPDVTHVLISGNKGSGKTQIAATLLASLALFQKPRELQLFVISAAIETFAFLEPLPHLVGGMAQASEHALQILRWLETELERREREHVARPRLIVTLDKLADVGADNLREFQVRLNRLAQRGRGAGISLVVCQRDGEHALINASLKVNFPVRLVAVRNERGFFDLFAGAERVRFQPAILPREEWTAFQAHALLNVKSRAKSASAWNRMIQRFKTR